MIEHFENAQALFSAGEYEWRISGIFTPAQIKKLKNTSLEKAYSIMNACNQGVCKIVTPEDKLYPRMLKTIDDLPAVLYYQGDLGMIIHKIAVAVVGTRNANENSLSVAKSLSASLVRSGAIVVSGAALGVDSAAHIGSIEAKGKTVAVLGNGFGAKYLQANQQLRESVAQNGVVLTEYPPEVPAAARNFPIRNRIISGLSHATVVIEASLKSGSLITAGLALEQGRDVFAVPGDVLSTNFKGVHQLISDGAKPVFSALDVLEEYALKYPKAIDINKIEKELKLNNCVEKINTKTQESREKPASSKSFERVADLESLSMEAKLVYAVLCEEAIHIDDIKRKTGFDFAKLFKAITELELTDLIVSGEGKIYSVKV